MYAAWTSPDDSDTEAVIAAVQSYKGAGGAVTIPGTRGSYAVETVSGEAFKGSNVTSVTLPEGLKTIENQAFYQCGSLESLSLPSTLSSIGAYVFYEDAALSSILFPNGSEYYIVKDGMLMDYGESNVYFVTGGHRDEFTIPKGVYYITSGAFSGIAPETLRVPRSLSVDCQFEVPACVRDLYFENANHNIDNWSFYSKWDSALEKNVATATVHAPAGGFLEDFCAGTEGDEYYTMIPFEAEGVYDPKDDPIDDPIVLTPGEPAAVSVYAPAGTYQPFTVVPSADGVYGFNFSIRMYSGTEDIQSGDVFFTGSIVDDDGNEVTMLLSDPIHKEYQAPGWAAYLKKNTVYTFRLAPSDLAKQVGVDCSLEMIMEAPAELTEDIPLEGLDLETHHVENMSRVFHLSPAESGQYWICYDLQSVSRTKVYAYLYEEAHGGAVKVAEGTGTAGNNQISAELTAGTDYYLVFVHRGTSTFDYGSAYISALTLTDDPCTVLRHTSGEHHGKVLPTCEEPGCPAYDVCSVCGKCYDGGGNILTEEDLYIAPTGHDWTGWVETTPATCCAPGEETRYCLNDDSHVENRATEKDPYAHDWGPWVVTKASTCTEKGSASMTCRLDSSHVETKALPLDNDAHDWGEPSYEWSNDCSTVTATRVCAYNDLHIQSETVETTCEVIKAPTCSEKGEGIFTAAFKNTAFTVEPVRAEITADPASHAWGEWQVTKAATCSEKGIETRVCSTDPSHTETRETVVSPNAHAWGEWQVTEAATTEAAGVETRVCKNDPSHKETRAIPKLPAPPVTVGTVAKQSAGTFIVTSVGTPAVTLSSAANKKSVTVPDAVTIEGKSYKVTTVTAGAFIGSKIRTVTLGKNIRTLKKNAFKGSQVTTLVIKTKNLKKATIKGSLKGSRVKTVKVKTGSSKVNKKYIKAYKKIFTKKIAGKAVKVK